MYGLEDESTKDVSKEKREEVTREVFKLFDADRNGVVERKEWMDGVAKGVVLPDFGVSLGESWEMGWERLDDRGLGWDSWGKEYRGYKY